MAFGLRTILLFPLVVGALLICAYMAAFGASSQVASWATLALVLALLGVMAVDVELVLLRPLRAVLKAAQDLAQSRGAAPPAKAPAGQLRALAQSVEGLRERLCEHASALAHERAQRHTLEQKMRELEERYALTVERANDGLWEWNVKSGAIDFSPRWRAMLRLTDAGLERIDDWRALLHPEERAGVLMRLESHLAGATPHFDEEYRLRSRDGEYRWFHSRGVAMRHASGKAYRVIVMDNDIHARKTLEAALIQAAEGLAALSGEDFYRQLMRSLSAILGTRDNLVCLCLGEPPTLARTLAYYSRGEFHETFDYELAGTSCGAVIDRGEIVYCPSGVCELWPEEKAYDRDSYVGVPMFDSRGKIIGHFACMDGAPMRQDLPHLALFKIFAVRAAAEIERMQLEQRLRAARAAERPGLPVSG